MSEATVGSLSGKFLLRRGRGEDPFCFDSGDFAIPLEGVTALFAPSGAGKTSFLRALAGLEGDIEGHLRCADELWLDGSKQVPAHQRRIGFVFQGGALFSQRSVQGNLLYAAKRAPDPVRKTRAVLDSAVRTVAEKVGVSKLLDRDVSGLSGGERQRVAIARALLAQPRILFLDEPLAGLDRTARDALIETIDALAYQAGMPILHVTHNAREVERLATRVLFLSPGKVESLEDLEQALARTDSPLFAKEGPAAVLQGRHEPEADGNCGHFVTRGGTKIHLAAPPQGPAGGVRRLRISASDVGIARDVVRGVSIQNQLPVRIVGMENWRPGRTLLRLSTTASEPLFAEITTYSAVRLGLEMEQVVHALIKSVALVR